MKGGVSVVIPAFNAAAFIGEAIESALTQTRAPDEIIVVDDGSTDGTAGVVASFGARVSYVRQENARQAAARNRGVRRSAGEFLAFLDADDVWRPEKLARQFAEINRSTAIGAVTCSMQTLTNAGVLGTTLVAGVRGRCFREILLGQVSIGAGSTWLVRRTVFEAVGGFGEALSPCEDTDFAWRAGTLSELESVSEPLVLYRLHGGNTHSNVSLTTPAWQRLYAGAFSHPVVRRQGLLFRARCRGRLYYMLSGDEARAGRRSRAAGFALRALLSWPPTAVRMARFPRP